MKFLVVGLSMFCSAFMVTSCQPGTHADPQIAQKASTSSPAPTTETLTANATPVEEELIPTVEAQKPAELLPDQVDLTQPVHANDLYTYFYANQEAWLGQTVQVVGYFKGTTHSSATDTTRIDLKTDQLGKTVVGGIISGKQVAPRSAVKQRAGVIIKGTIAEPYFGMVILNDASFQNRE